MATASSASKATPAEKTKVGNMETTELKNYSFPTIGEGGVVIAASSQEEANKAAKKLQDDIAKRDNKGEDKKEDEQD